MMQLMNSVKVINNFLMQHEKIKINVSIFTVTVTQNYNPKFLMVR